jgi:hypothetical protein
MYDGWSSRQIYVYSAALFALPLHSEARGVPASHGVHELVDTTTHRYQIVINGNCTLNDKSWLY